MSISVSFVAYKNPAPDMNKWRLGKSIYAKKNITAFPDLRKAIAAVHYYAWWGDADYDIAPMPGSENDDKRHAFCMQILERSRRILALKKKWFDIVTGWSLSASRWRKDLSAATRQQAYNRREQDEAYERIVSAFWKYFSQFSIPPAIYRLTILAKANWETVKKVLAKAGLLNKDAKALSEMGREPKSPQAMTDAILHPSHISSIKQTPFLNSTVQKEVKDKNNRDGERVAEPAMAQALRSLAAKITMPMLPRQRSGWEISQLVHQDMDRGKPSRGKGGHLAALLAGGV